MDIAAIAGRAPVIPVLTIQEPETAVALAKALVKGGLPVLEITLRTEAAVVALELIAQEVPDAIVGAGTVLNPGQLEQVQRAGARFGVSPGCTPDLAKAIGTSGLPFLPGVQTISEAMALADRGFHLLKFFPADIAGGTGWLKAAAAPLAGLR
ncbi:MAG: bifunctional 4-hydroxy-2-oxoglutarate aldolase/2-dehydro-3-deoxy-phosphogluconate aldolase, partial [Alphaproteobacteria bacterium]|nr:bifunctional 4-hydroxy-2-oxoglutarate aldolase/2-dehydro-3-deoxy-phosphogluconate aldolase [Alphaproteobacteria bacterium]